MDEVISANEFDSKFSELSQQNQKYIIAIQQALLYAQETEGEEKRENDLKLTTC